MAAGAIDLYRDRRRSVGMAVLERTTHTHNGKSRSLSMGAFAATDALPQRADDLNNVL